MTRSAAAAAVRRLERALEATPLDFALHQQLAEAHFQLLQREDREIELDAICREQPAAFTSQLHLAALFEGREHWHEAVAGFTRAIRTAQLRGFWFDEGSTPPWIRDLVLHAMDVAHHGRIELFHQVLEPMIARYGKDELGRVSRALAMYLDLEPVVRSDPRQQPSFLYIPGLPEAPVFPREALPFADWYEAQTEAIAAEMRAVRDGDGVQPFHYDVPEGERGKLTAGGAWDAYFFFLDGERVDGHHAACPATSKVLAGLPLDRVREHGPEVCFSIMRPGAHILPHRGVTNARAVLHLGLEIPDGCALNLVDVRPLDWQPGKCFAFDDTYQHEAWNRSDTTRTILLADIWNPYLRAAEREAIAELVGVIGDFNRDAAPAPLTR
ncbi:MAG: aspartyl beta-hydroxylase [Deltaproteobacteria bacterium]|nr:MAG: aspartyl beta-hydroxylase [Deltaproteobacteria bacterium]TMQ09331.1 MAG: aspartyl beta-hydroxylase [Deltaproteobacteria bacterium]